MLSKPRTDHAYWLSEFIRLENELGGPDPHLATVGKMLELDPELDPAWCIGCYALGYNVPTGEVIWQNWTQRAVLDNPFTFTKWVEDHWEGMGLRRERRAVRTPAKFSRCLISYARWLNDAGVQDWWYADDFPTAWREVSKIYGMGRYVLLKLVEGLCRYDGREFHQSDIRAHSGASPREGLSLLYPEHTLWLTSDDNTKSTVAHVEDLATRLRNRLAENYGVTVDYFTLQVVLCEYKKVSQGKQYPGRTHDTELAYYRASQKYWGNESRMLEARAAVFPNRILGEQRGWGGKREELSRTLPDHGYLWTDLSYDYWSTRDLAHPVVWP